MGVLLVRKRRKLVKAEEMVPTTKNVAAKEIKSARDAAKQEGGKPSWREGSAVLEVSGSEDGREGGQVALQLVLVPLESVAEEEPAEQKKQATKSRRLQALTAGQDMFCAASGMLGRAVGERGATVCAELAPSDNGVKSVNCR